MLKTNDNPYSGGYWATRTWRFLYHQARSSGAHLSPSTRPPLVPSSAGRLALCPHPRHTIVSCVHVVHIVIPWQSEHLGNLDALTIPNDKKLPRPYPQVRKTFQCRFLAPGRVRSRGRRSEHCRSDWPRGSSLCAGHQVAAYELIYARTWQSCDANARFSRVFIWNEALNAVLHFSELFDQLDVTLESSKIVKWANLSQKSQFWLSLGSRNDPKRCIAYFSKKKLKK